MPAPPTSLIDPAIGHLVELTGDAAKEWPVTALQLRANDQDLAAARHLALYADGTRSWWQSGYVTRAPIASLSGSTVFGPTGRSAGITCHAPTRPGVDRGTA